MKIARLLTVTLLLVAGASTVLASSASAIPKFKLPITKRGFTATSATSTFRIPGEKFTVTCGSASSAGAILSDDEIDVKIHYLDCFLKDGTTGPCTIKSVGAPGTEGLILTELLLGLLGLLHQPNGAAGILIEPKASHTFVTIVPTASPCGTTTTAIEGSVAALFSPTGKLQSTNVVFLGPTSEEGKQFVTLILTLNGIVKPKLTGFGAAEATQEQTSTETFEEAIEVS